MVSAFIGGALSALGGNLVSKAFGSSGSKSSWASSLKNAKDLTSYEMKLANNYNNKFLSNSAKTTLALNKSIMDYQYGLERESRRNSYVDTRKDLESAGFNPLLAVGQQSGYTAVGSGVSAESPMQEGSGIANSALDSLQKMSGAYDMHRQTTGNLQQIASDIHSSLYTNDLHSAQSELTRSQTRGQDISNMVDSIYKEKQAIANLDLTRQQKMNLLQDISESKARILKYTYENEASSAQSAMTRQNTAMMAPLARYIQSHPNLGGLLKSGVAGLVGLAPFALGQFIKGKLPFKKNPVGFRTK